MPELRVLVIGSKNHERAECFAWLESFPNVEEYDAVIINLQSLSQKILNRIQDKIMKLQEPINRVLSTNREIFCIMNNIITISYMQRHQYLEKIGLLMPINSSQPHRRSSLYLPSNYDWLRNRIRLNSKKSGTSIIIVNHRFDRYFQVVNKWAFTIDLRMKDYENLPIALNKSKDTISGSLKRISSESDKFSAENENAAIHFLPPPTKSKMFEAIETILDITFGLEEKLAPFWKNQIDIPAERELKTEIEAKNAQIKAIREEISQIETRIQRWNSYRDLLSERGDKLEAIVQKVLADLGINTTKTEKGYPADLINREVVIEVTGIKGSLTVSSEKVNQIGRLNKVYNKEQKAILIVNTYLDNSPNEREGKMNFSPEVKKYFDSSSVCYLTTMTLFQLWKDVMASKKDKDLVKNKILSKIGELTMEDFG